MIFLFISLIIALDVGFNIHVDCQYMVYTVAVKVVVVQLLLKIYTVVGTVCCIRKSVTFAFVERELL